MEIPTSLPAKIRDTSSTVPTLTVNTNTGGEQNQSKIIDRFSALLNGIINSINGLPSKDSIDTSVSKAKNQIAIGEVGLPYIKEAVESIKKNISTIDIDGLEKSFGIDSSEVDRMIKIESERDKARAEKDESISKILEQIHSLDYEKDGDKIAELQSKKASIEEAFYGKYGKDNGSDPVAKVKFAVVERIGTLTGAISDMNTAIAKTASISTYTKDGSDIGKEVAKATGMITNGYNAMVTAIADAANSIASNDIQKIIGWKDSGQSEYVTVDVDDGHGGKYKEILTKKEYDKSTGEWKDVKIENPSYYKPHFEAEENILKIGEFISKMVQPIQKVSNIDLGKLSGPRKIQNDMNRIAGSMSSMVRSVVSSFSKINTEGSKEAIELLIGDQGTETIKDTISSTNLSSDNESLVETNQSTDRIISGKRASVIDVMSSFIDSCNKITAFDTKPIIKKSSKFKMTAPIVGIAFRGVLNSMYKMIPSKEDFDYDGATEDIQGLNKYIENFTGTAFNSIVSMRLPNKKLGDKLAEVRRTRRLTSKIVGNVNDIVALFIYGAEDEDNVEEDKKGILTRLFGKKKKRKPIDKSEYKSGMQSFRDDLESIEDISTAISSMKIATKDAKKTNLAIVGTKAMINRAIGLSEFIERKMSELDSSSVAKTTAMASSVSDTIVSMKPGVEAMTMVSLLSNVITPDSVKTTQNIMETFVDTVEYASTKNIDFKNITDIQIGLADTMKQIIKLMLLSKVATADKKWIDDLFSEDGAMTKFIDSISRVYAQFESRRMDSSAMENLNSCLVGTEDAIAEITKILVSAKLLSIVSGSIKPESISGEVLGEGGPIFVLIESISGILDKLEESGLDEEGIETAGNNIDEMVNVTAAITGMMLSARLLSKIVDGAKVDEETEEKAKSLLNVLMAPIEELGSEETYDKIKRSVKSILLLSLELLVLTAVTVLIGTVVATHAKAALIGMLALGLLVWSALQIMDELSDRSDDGTIRDGVISLMIIAGAFMTFSMSILVLGLTGDVTFKSLLMFALMVGMAIGVLLLVNRIVDRDKVGRNGIPEACLPLLLIAGSFIMFSMSILMLGLVQDLAFASIVAFILMVGMAVGVLFLLSRLNGEVIKGSLALMVAGAAFMMFSVVIAILAKVAEGSDFVEMLGLVGVIAALVGVGVLAGLAIIPLALGSLGLIVLSASLLVFSVAITALYGVSKLIGKDAEEAISPLIDTIDVIVEKMSALSMKAVAVATANSLLALVMIVSMVGVAAMIQALKAIAPKPSETEEVSLAMQGVVNSLNTVSKELSKISLGDMTKALVITTEALLMLVPLSLVALILLGFSRMRIATEFDSDNKPTKWESLDGSSFDRVGEVMSGLAIALKDISRELSKISIKEMTKAAVLANEALITMVPLSIVALILLGFSRMRIATEFDSDNKPTKWESLDGSSFDRVGDTMEGMVSAINNTVDKINEVGIVAMTKAVAKSVEMLAMVASLSGVMGLLAKMGSGRIAVEWDKDNKPTKWENFDSGMIDRSVDIARLLVESVGSISKSISEYDTGDLKKAKKNAKTLKGILKPISSMLDIVIKLTSGPLNYGPCDEEGNPIGTGDKSISGNVGDYLKSHKKQITDNIDTIIDIFNGIAEKVSGDGGIGKIDKSTLKRAKKNMKLVGQITGSLQPMIDLITSLTSGQFNVGTEEEPKMMNLGDYISKKKPEVTNNLDNLFDFIMWIGQKADKMNEGPSNKELRRANRKMGKIGDIIESLNAPLDLIMKMSDGEFEIKDEQGNLIEKMNLGKYIAAKSKDVESNLDTLISFIGHIGDKINTELNGDGGPSKRDLKKADKKTGLIGNVLETMIGTLDIIEKMASGQIQVGVDENDNPIMKNLSQFLNDSADGIKENIGLLIDFIVGPDGIQSQIDKITGEKSNTSEKKQNQIDTIQMFSDTIGDILDLTMDIGKQIDDPKTRDLFGTDKDKSMKARIGRLMEGYSVPMDDTAIFSKTSEFMKRYRHLSDYDVLMKRIMDVRHVDNFEKSVKATGDMVNSINSINDTKIDKLNNLMRNMIEFGKTMDESLKEVFDRIVELAEELHYIIEADMKKNNPEEYKKQKQQEQRQMQASANPLSPKNQQPQQSMNRVYQPTDMSVVEDKLTEITNLVKVIQSKMS